MFEKLYVLSLIICLLSLNASAAEPLNKSALTGGSDKIIFTDVDKDGDPDVMERWWNGFRCRWIDENDDMLESDMLGDIVSDCLQVDKDKDGTYDGPTDLNIKWADNDGDGRADMQVVVINPKKGEEKKFGGVAHYMVFDDTDKDGVMVYFDWSNFGFHCWNNTGRCNFSPDYNGDSVFLKSHMAPFALSDARLNWENPFAFFDTDDDGCTEMSVRFIDNPLCDAKANAVFVAYDLDNDTQRDNELDYDMAFEFGIRKPYDYSKYANKAPDVKAAQWVLPYFQHKEWRTIDEFIYIPHEKCYENAFLDVSDKCIFIFDEDDDDHRWERVEMYYPNDPYALRGRNSFEAKRSGHTTPMNIHPQSDSLGDRGEFDTDNSGKGKLYISKWDRRFHLYGAEWGAWTLDSEAKYFGAVATPNVSSQEKAKSLEEVVLYYDTNNNGFIDLVEFDYDSDRVPELTVNLLDYGNDEYELLDPKELKWDGLHEVFKENAAASWQEAYGLYRSFWKTGLSNKKIDDLSFASSTWEKYFYGWKLKDAIFRCLDSKLDTDVEKRIILHKYYFSGNFEAMAEWISETDFNKEAVSGISFKIINPLDIARKDEIVSIPFAKLENMNIDYLVVSKEGVELSSQLDDSDFDGNLDSLVFLVDIAPMQSAEITVSTVNKVTSYPLRAHSEISIVSGRKEAVGTGSFVDNGTFLSKKYLCRRPGNTSSSYRFEGPLIESDKIGYRLYWDSRGAIDIFGKTSEQFVGHAHSHKVSHHTMQSWGRDLLHNGTALGVGGLAVGTSDERFSPAKAPNAKIVIGSDGPIKASYRMVYDGFDYKGKRCSLTWDVSMFAGQRYLDHKVKVTSGGELPLMAALTNHSDEHELVELHDLSDVSAMNVFASYGDQVFADSDPEKAKLSEEMMGMALLWESDKADRTQETDLEYRVLFKATDSVEYYSLAAYNGEYGEEAIENVDQFENYLDMLRHRLVNPIIIKYE